LGDEIAVRSCRRKRLDENFQLTIASVETLRIKRQQQGKAIANDLSSVMANLLLQAAATQDA
jgi:hypothetical protein